MRIDGAEIRLLGVGGWFGEIALLRDVPRTATVSALTDVALWVLDRDSFLSSVGAAPDAVETAGTYGRANYT